MSYWPVAAKTKLKELMQVALVDAVNANDPSRVSRIVIGRFRENPTKVGPIIEIYENDPEGPGWEHHIVTETNNENSPHRYVDTISRSRSLWNRRFVIQVVMFMRGTDPEDVDNIKGEIIQRIEAMILENVSLDGLVDDGGEQSYGGRIVKEEGRQTGDDKTPIWRTKLWLEFKTQRRRRL